MAQVQIHPPIFSLSRTIHNGTFLNVRVPIYYQLCRPDQSIAVSRFAMGVLETEDVDRNNHPQSAWLDIDPQHYGYWKWKVHLLHTTDYPVQLYVRRNDGQYMERIEGKGNNWFHLNCNGQGWNNDTYDQTNFIDNNSDYTTPTAEIRLDGTNIKWYSSNTHLGATIPNTTTILGIVNPFYIQETPPPPPPNPTPEPTPTNNNTNTTNQNTTRAKPEETNWGRYILIGLLLLVLFWYWYSSEE